MWFESRCSHLNFRYRTCFEQGVHWHSGNYRVWIHSETRNGEGLRDVQHSMSMILDTRFHIWFFMTLYYKTQQILLQNATAILLQNATEVYYKMRQIFYYKIRQLYYKMWRLLQIATVQRVTEIYPSCLS